MDEAKEVYRRSDEQLKAFGASRVDDISEQLKAFGVFPQVDDIVEKLEAFGVPPQVDDIVEKIKAFGVSPQVDDIVEKFKAFGVPPQVNDIVGEQLKTLGATSQASDIGLWQGLEASEASRMAQRLNEGLEAISRQAELAAFRPKYEELAEMAAHAKPAWSELLTNSAASYAFAALATLREALEQSPFAEATMAALRSQLGDWSDIGLSPEQFDQQKRQEIYLRAGLDPRLINLEPQTFEAMLEATQLRPATPPPLRRAYVSADLETLETSDAAEPYRLVKAEEVRKEAVQAGKTEAGEELEQEESLPQNVRDYQRLSRFESQFRGFVSEKLEAAAGPKWFKQRVPSDCLKNWRDRLTKDRDTRNHHHELLSYSDLGDWSKIILRADNWTLFEPYFKRKTFVEESFIRLIPLRNDIAHMRPLTKADRLVFYAEIKLLSLATRGPQAHDEDDDSEEDALFQ
jgi:hypothetical protein